MKRETHGDETRQLQETPSTRREVLRGGLLIAGAAAAARVIGGGARPAEAANGAPLLLGQPNNATSPTTLSNTARTGGLIVTNLTTDPNQPLDTTLVSALRGDGGRIGVEGNSPTGVGVLGQTGTAVITDPNEPLQVGVYGASHQAIGVGGRSITGFGVMGQTGGELIIDPNDVDLPIAGIIGLAGINGDPNDPGALAGVLGYAQDPNNPAVFARSSSIEGLALNVHGRASFSSAGTGKIDAGARSGEVRHPAVSPSSIVLVTLSSDPVGGRRLKYVDVREGTFEVFLSGKAKVAVNFGYLVVN